MSRPYLNFDIDGVEQFLYPVAQRAFDRPDYAMPALKWLNRERMESALYAVQNGYFDDIFEAAAALAYYVNKAHALLDGNKRMTLVILYSFLLLNGYIQTELQTYEETASFTEWLAASESTDKEKVIAHIREKLVQTMRPLTDEERAELLRDAA